MQHPDPKLFTEPSKFIDCNHDEIVAKADKLLGKTLIETAKNCFEFVRDEIQHSSDFELGPITCRASDVLKFGTGFCYAKSHLLCALLRANNIPAGLCYQRLLISDLTENFCLHGMNAIFIKEYGWYRVDPRGNKPKVNAQFTPPTEQLAFPITHPGEADFPEIYVEPLPQVVECLFSNSTWQEVCENLPDVKV